MAIWIITTGSSDVQLKTEKNWSNLYNDRKKQVSVLKLCSQLRTLSAKDSNTNFYCPPPRALGLLYRGDSLKEHCQDLEFPLLDTFCKLFDETNAPDRAIVLLTDQSELFTEKDKKLPKCPFWQDTCELQEIFTHYFQKLETEKNLHIKPYFATIKPQNGKGIDNWNEMLDAVDMALNDALDDAVNKLQLDLTNETIYVSHQAGTPAISSAVQFLTISKFNHVRFLISNQSYQDDELKSVPDMIDSSQYWRGLQIQKAKKLIIDGFPGAALELVQEINRKVPGTIGDKAIKDLEKIVRRFNIKAKDQSTDNQCPNIQHYDKGDPSEFQPDKAAERIVDVLDLVEILFQNESYAQGVALLAAAQETFLKAAIVHQIHQLTQTIAGIPLSEAIAWDNRGLHLKAKKNIEQVAGFQGFTTLDNQLKNTLKFPQGDSYRNHRNRNENKTFQINNTTALKWLEKLVTGWVSWPLLNWSCVRDREFEQDFRNQLMHNLRGVTKKDVICYLQCPGGGGTIASDDLMAIYLKYVKQPFRDALRDVGLSDNDSIDNKLQQELRHLAAKLS